MPLVKIETLSGRDAEARRDLLDAVHDALVEAFEIPDDDRHQRFIEYQPADFEVPPGRSSDGLIVTIDAFAGRSPRAKANLYKAVVQRFEELGVDPTDVLIVVNDIPL